MGLTKAKASAVGKDETPGGGAISARRADGVQVELTNEYEVEIELTASAPTIQQQQAYERFWKLFIERLVRERQLDKNRLKA